MNNDGSYTTKGKPISEGRKYSWVKPVILTGLAALTFGSCARVNLPEGGRKGDSSNWHYDSGAESSISGSASNGGNDSKPSSQQSGRSNDYRN